MLESNRYLMERISTGDVKKNPFIWASTSLLAIVGIGMADYETGSEFGFSLFYLLPIVMVTWAIGRNVGFVFCIIATITWFGVDNLSGHAYSQPVSAYWNAFMRFGFFMIVAYLLPLVQEIERERHFSRIDYLTGIANRRHFIELVEFELSRSLRYNYPLTIAYIDFDGFKRINDKYGHLIGDKLLCAIVYGFKKQLRNTDVIGRIGGDEFALLLPEVDKDTAQLSVKKINDMVISELQEKNWKITFSIGVLTYQGGTASAEELIGRADQLMYSIKNNGKNAISFGIYS